MIGNKEELQRLKENHQKAVYRLLDTEREYQDFVDNFKGTLAEAIALGLVELVGL